jgi:hypothetical protein
MPALLPTPYLSTKRKISPEPSYSYVISQTDEKLLHLGPAMPILETDRAREKAGVQCSALQIQGVPRPRIVHHLAPPPHAQTRHMMITVRTTSASKRRIDDLRLLTTDGSITRS